jgi:hypothetical protein
MTPAQERLAKEQEARLARRREMTRLRVWRHRHPDDETPALQPPQSRGYLSVRCGTKAELDALARELRARGFVVRGLMAGNWRWER